MMLHLGSLVRFKAGRLKDHVGCGDDNCFPTFLSNLAHPPQIDTCAICDQFFGHLVLMPVLVLVSE
jgi:hypothetical protein